MKRYEFLITNEEAEGTWPKESGYALVSREIEKGKRASGLGSVRLADDDNPADLYYLTYINPFRVEHYVAMSAETFAEAATYRWWLLHGSGDYLDVEGQRVATPWSSMSLAKNGGSAEIFILRCVDSVRRNRPKTPSNSPRPPHNAG